MSWQSLLLETAAAYGVKPNVGVHLAVLREPFFSRICNGTKTVESRWSMVRCAPYGQIHGNDLVFIKRSGGFPVWGCFTASWFAQWSHLTADVVAFIREKWGSRLGLDGDAEQFWAERAAKKYATLIEVGKLRKIEGGVYIAKKDRAGWVVLRNAAGGLL